MVIVLAIGRKFRGLKSVRVRWLLTAIIFRSMTPFGRGGGELKPSATCRKILRHAKDHLRYYRDTDRKIQRLFTDEFPPTSILGVCCNRSRELWYINQEWLVLRWGEHLIRKWSQL
jgi:hypothetical protein